MESLAWSAFMEGKNSVESLNLVTDCKSVQMWQPSPGDSSRTGWNSRRKSAVRGAHLSTWKPSTVATGRRTRAPSEKAGHETGVPTSKSVKEARPWLMTVAAVWYHHRCSPVDLCQWPVCFSGLSSSGQWLFDFNLQPQDFNICLSWKRRLLCAGRARRATYRWSDGMKENIHLNWIRLRDVAGPCCPHDNLFLPSRRNSSGEVHSEWHIGLFLLFLFVYIYR